MKTSAVIFDAFGTLVEIRQPKHPFRQLLREGRRQGRLPRADDIRTIMTRCLSLSEAALSFGIRISPSQLAFLDQCLEEELASIRPYPDAVEAVGLLQAAGVRLAMFKPGYGLRPRSGKDIPAPWGLWFQLSHWCYETASGHLPAHLRST